MKQKEQKNVICPNCFGTSYREVLATATSRNIVHDDSLKAVRPAEVKGSRRQDVIKMLCVHCGHEVSRKGCRV